MRSRAVGSRQMVFHEFHGCPLPKGAGSLAGDRVPLDEASRWIRRVSFDTGQGQGGRIDPGAVAIHGLQQSGTIGYDGIQIPSVGTAIGKGIGKPTATPQEGLVLIGSGIPGNLGKVGLSVRRACQTAFEKGQTPCERVDVAVTEGREDQTAGERNGFRIRADEGSEAWPVAHIDDLACPDGNGFGPGFSPVGRIDRGVPEDPIGVEAGSGAVLLHGFTNPRWGPGSGCRRGCPGLWGHRFESCRSPGRRCSNIGG